MAAVLWPLRIFFVDVEALVVGSEKSSNSGSAYEDSVPVDPELLNVIVAPGFTL